MFDKARPQLWPGVGLRRSRNPVWPDFGIKYQPIFPKVAQKVGTAAFTYKVVLFKIAKKSLNISATFVWQLLIKNFLKMTNLVTLEEPDVEVVVKVVHISWRLIHLLTKVWSLNIGDPLPSPRYFLNFCTTTAKSNNNDITILGFVKKLSIVGTDIHCILGCKTLCRYLNWK